MRIFLFKEGTLYGLACCHVDNFLWGGDVLFEEIIRRFRCEFTVGSEEKTDFQYLGVHLNMLENGLFISQTAFVDSLEEIASFHVEKEPVRTALGKLQWVATQSRPDISFRVSELLSRTKFDDPEMVRDVNKVIRQLKYEKNVGFLIKRFTVLEECLSKVIL